VLGGSHVLWDVFTNPYSTSLLRLLRSSASLLFEIRIGRHTEQLPASLVAESYSYRSYPSKNLVPEVRI
jgi:hypothetical protein